MFLSSHNNLLHGRETTPIFPLLAFIQAAHYLHVSDESLFGAAVRLALHAIRYGTTGTCTHWQTKGRVGLARKRLALAITLYSGSCLSILGLGISCSDRRFGVSLQSLLANVGLVP